MGVRGEISLLGVRMEGPSGSVVGAAAKPLVGGVQDRRRARATARRSGDGEAVAARIDADAKRLFKD